MGFTSEMSDKNRLFHDIQFFLDVPLYIDSIVSLLH